MSARARRRGSVRDPSARDASLALSERLGMAVLVFGMGCGLAVQFALAWAWARPAPGPPALGLGGGMLLAALSRTLASVARDDGGADSEITWIGLLLGFGLALAFIHIQPGAGMPALLALAEVWTVWWLTGYVWRNLLLAVPPLREAGAGPDRDAHGQTVGSGNVDIAANVQAGAFGGVLAGAAVALAGLQLRHGHKGPPPEIGALAIAIQCACACLLVAQGQRRALLREARVYRASVLPGFSTGSAAGALGATVALTALALVLPAYPSLFTPHGIGAAIARIFGGVMRHTIAPGAVLPARPSALPTTTANPGGGSPASGGRGGFVSLLTIIGAAAGIVVLAFGLRLAWTAVRSRFGRRISLLEFLASVWSLILELLAALFSGGGLLGLWRMLVETRSGAQPASGAGNATSRRASLLRRLADPRLRVRTAYRHMLFGVGGKGHRRPFWFTPGRFRRLLEPSLPGNHGELSQLTALYEEARYSTHDIADQAAGQAEAAAEAVIRSARPTQAARAPED